VCELAAPGERPLVVGGLRDRPGPARGGLLCEGALALRPPLAVVRRPGRAPHLQITGGERAEQVADQAQHLLVPGTRTLEPGTDRDPGGAGHHERRRHLPQPAHPFTPGPVSKKSVTPPNDHHRRRSHIRCKNSRSLPRSVATTRRPTHARQNTLRCRRSPPVHNPSRPENFSPTRRSGNCPSPVHEPALRWGPAGTRPRGFEAGLGHRASRERNNRLRLSVLSQRQTPCGSNGAPAAPPAQPKRDAVRPEATPQSLYHGRKPRKGQHHVREHDHHH
jgi:hypothetical protein